MFTVPVEGSSVLVIFHVSGGTVGCRIQDFSPKAGSKLFRCLCLTQVRKLVTHSITGQKDDLTRTLMQGQVGPKFGG